MVKNWNAIEETKLVAFHGWQALKHLCLLGYHALCSLCNVVLKLLVTHCINAIWEHHFVILPLRPS